MLQKMFLKSSSSQVNLSFIVILLHVGTYSRAVKLAEKLHFKCFTKKCSKFKLYSNLKGINSVKKKKKSFWLLS